MSADDGITVAGGAGGTKACLIALAHRSDACRTGRSGPSDAARHAAHAADAHHRTADLSPTTAAPARESLAGLVTGPHGLRRRSERLHELAGGLRGAAEAYARADADAASTLAAVVQAAGRGLGELGPVGGVIAGVAGRHRPRVGGRGDDLGPPRPVHPDPSRLGGAAARQRRRTGPTTACSAWSRGSSVDRASCRRSRCPAPTRSRPRSRSSRPCCSGSPRARAPFTGDPVVRVAALTVARSRGRASRSSASPCRVCSWRRWCSPRAEPRARTSHPRRVADVLREVDSVAGDVEGSRRGAAGGPRRTAPGRGW